MSSPRSGPSCFVSKKVTCIFEETTIIDDPDEQETIPMEPNSHFRPLHQSSYQQQLHVNTYRRQPTQTSLYDFPPQAFQDRYGTDGVLNDEWGTTYKTKPTNSIRLWYTNPNGLGINPTGVKSHSTFSFLYHKIQAVIVSLAETNLN